MKLGMCFLGVVGAWLWSPAAAGYDPNACLAGKLQMPLQPKEDPGSA